jgi:proline iminopeptidase
VLVPTGAGVEFYRRTFSPALRRRFRFLFVEMRGTGGSTGTVTGATFGSLADDLEAVRVALDLGPAVVLGHSNHGCIALEHGLRHPEGNAGVISVASLLDGREAFAIGSRRWEAEASDSQRRALAEGMAAFAALAGAPMSDDERAIREYLSIAPLCWRDPELAWPCWGGFPGGAAHYFTWMRAAIPAFDATARIGGLRRPLLGIVGRTDYVCPLETWAAAASVSGVEVVCFESSSHNPQVEERARFDALVEGFITAPS